MTVKLQMGESQDLTVAHESASAPGTRTGFVHVPVTWSSSDEDVAVVVSTGLVNTDGHSSSFTTVTAVGAGKCTVTADTGDDTATIDVEVSPESTDPLVIQPIDAVPGE